ncbi:MAG: phospho-N-acetylmuramoyl-pentapeptide-transferase [Lachnospiraceae bacterium]|nr:phospho-N-acetylmuramoyl-pentapeptide-transferase [Lachnospiraceae bacterium]
MSGATFLAVFISFVITTVCTKLLIPVLHKIKFGQQVRDDGPQTHLKKQGTPTMGGIAFLAGIIITCVIFAFWHPRVWPVLAMTVAFGLVGFIDDYLKIVKKNTKGLKPLQKIAMQFVIMAAFCVYMMVFDENGTGVHIPFTEITVRFGWFYPVLLLFVVLGTDNGVNFTDGVDGLCSSVTAIVAVFVAVTSFLKHSDISTAAGAVLGGMLGFLIFNAYPAKVFMGDTGALALGGFVSSSFLLIGEPLLILIVGFVYFAEVLSSIIQVSYFKATHGKRIFRMAPIHHHFELGGWSETRVVTVFTIVTVLLSFVGLLSL